MVRKCFGNKPLKDLTMERKRVEEFEESLIWRLWMNQSCFSLGFISQNYLWKLLFFCGYKGYLYWCVYGMWRVSFSQIEWIGDLASRLDWVATPLHASLVCILWRLASCKQAVRSSRESLAECTILSFSSHSLTHYPYMILT